MLTSNYKSASYTLEIYAQVTGEKKYEKYNNSNETFDVFALSAHVEHSSKRAVEGQHGRELEQPDQRVDR